MKKLLIIAATLALMGAGCAAQTDVNVDTSGQPNGQTTTNQNPNGPDTFPDGQGPGVTVTGDAGIIVDAVAMTAKVTFNGSAFSPATVTIGSGGTVTWKNAGTGDVRVASDPHPTHTNYPGFDSKSSIHAGQEWSFTFTKPGTWGYHNHFNPSITGTVIVK